MRRVVVTGIGIVSSIGNNTGEVYNSLVNGKSGITKNEDMAAYGFRSQIAGNIKLDVREHVDKRTLRFMGCLLYTSPSPRDLAVSRMPSSA